MVYYNENDPFAAAWLRELIAAGEIAPGEVDERDIRDVVPTDLRGYAQCHWFAGIGTWSYALRLAGWDDDRPVWTGSCPCQPFSAAGKAAGFTDERHLWPAWFHLIRECRPSTLFGEQVTSPDALRWLDLVQDDLEGAGYAVGAADICAAGCGAPHIRQRLYFVADTERGGRHDGRRRDSGRAAESEGREAAFGGLDREFVEEHCAVGLMAHASRHERGARRAGETDGGAEQSAGCGDAFLVGNPGCAGLEGRSLRSGEGPGERATGETGPLGGFWRDSEWIYCRDEKYRPVEAGTFPLSHGASARMGRLRGYGNSLVAPLAAEFIQAYLDARNL